MSISTKTGDKGQTQWRDKRLSKGEINFEFVGNLDELNAWLGMVKSFSSDLKYNHLLTQIQKDIMLLSSLQAFSQLVDVTQVLRRLRKGLKDMESAAAKLEKELPSQKHFLLPGGTKEAVLTNVARTVCRRAERSAVRYFGHRSKKEGIEVTLAYLNRLSDFLHLLMRWFNFRSDKQEEYWV